jgi:hypothetical protein
MPQFTTPLRFSFLDPLFAAPKFSFRYLVPFKAWPINELLFTPDSTLVPFSSKCITYGEVFYLECIKLLKSFDDFVFSRADLLNNPLCWIIFYWIILGIFDAELCVDDLKYWGYWDCCNCYLFVYFSFDYEIRCVFRVGFSLNSNLDRGFLDFICPKSGLCAIVTL